MPSEPLVSRRLFLASSVGGLALVALPRVAMAMSADEAKALVDKTKN